MPRLVLALLLVVAVGCDSVGGDTALAGPYEGDVTAAFADGISIDFEIRLDLDEPDAAPVGGVPHWACHALRGWRREWRRGRLVEAW